MINKSVIGVTAALLLAAPAATTTAQESVSRVELVALPVIDSPLVFVRHW